MGQPVVHFEIIGNEPQKLRSFYSELFGWKLGEMMAPEMGSYSMIDGESAGIPGGIGADQTGKARTTIYVQVPDLQATLNQAKAKGGNIVMEPMEIPGGNVTIAMFTDPEGNLIGLTKG